MEKNWEHQECLDSAKTERDFRICFFCALSNLCEEVIVGGGRERPAVVVDVLRLEAKVKVGTTTTMNKKAMRLLLLPLLSKGLKRPRTLA